MKTVLRICVAALGLLLMSAHAQISLRAELAKPVTSAQSLLADQKSQDALVKLEEARQVSNLSEDERVLVERLSVVAALGAKNNDRAVQSLNYLLDSQKVSAADKSPLIETLISIHQSTKNHRALIQAAQNYFQKGGENPRIRLPFAQALAIDKQYQAALDQLSKKGLADSSAPTEAELRVAIFANSRLKNDAALLGVLKTTISLYPKTDYWTDLLSLLLRRSGLTKRQEMDIYLLMEEVGALSDEDDYLDMMDVALKVGLPKDTLRLASKAQAAKLISKANEPKVEGYKTQAQKSSLEDDVFKQSAIKTSNEHAQLGDLYSSEKSYDKAILHYELALKTGGLKYEQETLLHYGVALYKLGKITDAKSQLLKIKGDDQAQQMAELWVLLIK